MTTYDDYSEEYEEEREAIGTVAAITIDGVEEYLVYDDGVEDDVLPAPTWHSTDAWRGYYEIATPEGYTNVANGWTTGWADDTVVRKFDTYAVAEALYSDDTRFDLPSFDSPIYVVSLRTSNVFSTAVDILVPEGEEERFFDFIEEKTGLKAEDVEYAFS